MQPAPALPESHRLRGSSKCRAPRFALCPAHTLKIEPARKHCQRWLAHASSFAPAAFNACNENQHTEQTSVHVTHRPFLIPIKAAMKPGHKQRIKNTFSMAQIMKSLHIASRTWNLERRRRKHRAQVIFTAELAQVNPS